MHGLQFGVEIESEGVTKNDAFRFLSSQADRSDDYHRTIVLSGMGWKVKDDGSLRHGCEICSDIMTEVNLPSIKRLLPLMKRIGLAGRDKSGIHVHVGVSSDLLSEHRNLFMKNWRNLLPRLKRVYTPRPCRMEFTKFEARKRDWVGHRYMALNISQSHHRTVEFRLFNTQLDYRYILRAIRFSCNFTKLTLAGRTLKTKPGESIEAMFKRELEHLAKSTNNI